MTREKERLQWQRKTELTKAYGLIEGLTQGIKAWEDFNKAGLVSVLEEVKDILAKHVGVK